MKTQILFNDLSLKTSLNLLDKSFSSSIGSIKKLTETFEVYANISEIKKFHRANKDELELEALGNYTILGKIIDNDYFQDLNVDFNTEQVYYIKSSLTTNDAISNSILDYVQKQMNKNYILIINMLDNEYSLRSFIPIFSTNANKYELKNLPCFTIKQIDEVKKYVYCVENILPILDQKDKIQEIIKTYIEECTMLLSTWKISFDASTKSQTLFRLVKTTQQIVEYSTPIGKKTDMAFKDNPSLAKKIAKIITEINGWKKDEQRSSINFIKNGGGQRDVYKPDREYEGSVLYVSVDTENGEFEVHTEKKRQKS